MLHSGHLSRVFTSLMGTSCNLRWREAGDRELIWTVSPSHPIARGVPHPLELGRHEAPSAIVPVETLESPVGWYRPQGAQDMAGS